MSNKPKIPANVIIDEEDRARLEEMGRWHINNHGYCRKAKLVDNKYKIVYMHRVIMNCPDNMVIDHINHNKLDNRKCNLRIVTQQQNLFNRKDAKGVRKLKNSTKWQARICLDYKEIHLGCFDTEQEARTAYLEAKQKYHRIGEQ